MSVISNNILAGAAGAAGPALYVDDVFSTYLYDGTGASHTITNGIDLSGEGGMVWIKSRDATYNHQVFDTERGVQIDLNTNDATANRTDSQNLTAFNSNGFTLGTLSTINSSSYNYASWTFRKAPGFFDVVTYTGNGTAGRTVSHNLGSVPGFIVVKELSTTSNWVCYHRSTGNDYALYLNKTDAADGPNKPSWNQTTPTSTEFTVGVDGYHTNDTNITYVAYLFAHDDQSFGTNSDEAIIKCGSYTGASAPNAVNVGFEPQFVIVKRTDDSNNWVIHDAMRVAPQELEANTSNAEVTENGFTFTSTGFELTDASGQFNTNNASYIYIAIRRPHKPPEAGTDVFAADAYNSSAPRFTAGFPVDMGWWWDRTSGSFNARVMDRFRETKALQTNSTGAEFTQASGNHFDFMEDWYDAALGSDFFSHMFKRAPGFFDMVAYTGTGSARTVDHNLTVAPEMMIVKKRSAAANWQVYHSSQGNGKYSPSFRTDPFYTSSSRWNDTSPTSTQFTVGTDADVNQSSATYVTYLFATLSGISKVGSYTGTGSAGLDVDCGFTTGARFVLIKRADSEVQGSAPDRTNWYLWDSTRGIVSGDDPWIALNETSAEVTNTDYIDPLSSGFTVASTGSGLNASGGTYIFLAIA